MNEIFKDTFIKNLPRDIIEKIFKYVLEIDPLQIVSFNKEYFSLIEYSEIEKKKMILDTLFKIHETTKYNPPKYWYGKEEHIPLFENEILLEYIINLPSIYIKSIPRSYLYHFGTIMTFCGDQKFPRNNRYRYNSLVMGSNFSENKIILKALKIIKKIEFSTFYDFAEVLFIEAAHSNNFKVLQWLYSMEIPKHLFPCFWKTASFRNNFEMLKWLKEKFCYPDHFSLFSSYYNCFVNNNLEMQKWMEKNWIVFKAISNSHDDYDNYKKEIISQVIGLNNIENLKIVKSEEKENFSYSRFDINSTKRMNYNSDILKRMFSPGTIFYLDENCCSSAVKNNNMEFLKWLINQNPPFPWNKKESISKYNTPEMNEYILYLIEMENIN
jgi:hypothetical protein